MTCIVFVVGAVAVWISGSALSRHADAIAERTGLSHAFIGMLLLGASTSLPEVATTASASLQGHPVLAGTNLLGSVAMQIAVLAAIDGFALRGKALTHFSASPAFLMQAVLLALLLAMTAAGIAIGEVFMLGRAGSWSLILAGAYTLSMYVIYRYERVERWEPVGEELPDPGGTVDEQPEDAERRSLAGLATRFVIATAIVFVSGWAVATSGARLAEITGLGETFIGATLMAVATSLPEVSTTYAAVRLGAFPMAVGNIFGTNAIDLALFLPADLMYANGTIIGALDQRSVFITALGIVLSCLYLWGVLERRDRTVLGFGIDSAAVLVLYACGMLLLYLQGLGPA